MRSFPTITGIAPANGGIGSSVSISGTNSMDATSLAFNGTAVLPFTTPSNDFSATATVPSGATTGPVSVASATLANYSGPTFTVAYPDLVVSIYQQLAAGIYNNVTITSTGAGYFASPDQLFQVMGKMVIQSGGFFSGNGTIVTGSGSFALSRRAQLQMSTPGGISASGATGDIQVTGTRYYSPDATYNYIGSVAQITGSGLPSRVNSLANYNQHQVTFTNSLAIRNVLSYYNGTPPVRAAGITLTLLSDKDSTASMEYAGTPYPGSFIVQRYVSGDVNAGAGYRHVSAPVAGATVASLTTTGYSPLVNSVYNTSATPGTVTPFPTVYSYDETRLTTATNNLSAFEKGYFSPASLTTALGDGLGYTVHIPAVQTFNFTGTIRSGVMAVPLTGGTDPNAGWQLVGNPYAATFNMASLANTTGVDNAKYVFVSSGPYAGTYCTYLPSTGDSPGIGSGLVALCQAFFTRVSTGSTSATLTMNSNNTVQSDNTVFHRQTADSRPLVQLELRGTGLADVLVAYAEAGATSALDAKYDALKLPNSTGLNLASVASSGENLAIDGRPAFTAATVLPLTVGVPAVGTYALVGVSFANLPTGLDIYLRDAQTGQTSKLSAGTSYSFSVSATQAVTPLKGRFTLLFSTSSPLATVATLTADVVSVYPNPSHGRFTVGLPGVTGASTVQTELLNTLGQVVRRQSAALPASGTTLPVETGELASGIYNLRLTVGATLLTQRIVVQ